jgi:hypothetical protein
VKQWNAPYPTVTLAFRAEAENLSLGLQYSVVERTQIVFDLFFLVAIATEEPFFLPTLLESALQ